MNNVLLSDIFHVKGRYQRSVHLERDFYSENSLNEYILTVTAREMLDRIVHTFENETTSKAWSITGPYGSGKSAFALYAAKLLGKSDDPTTQHAVNLLRSGDPSLYERFISTNGNSNKSTQGFYPVLISGERAPLSVSLLRGLERGLTAANGALPDISLIQDLEPLLERVERNDLPSASEITHLYEQLTQQICAAGGSGLLLVVDELGKFLEYATQHPEHGDMFILQNLAEFADRSKDTPLFLMTILHQSFESYAQRAAKSQREEWAKIQGRFEDVAFVEPTEQVLRLVGEALENRSEIDVNQNLETVLELGLKPHQLEDTEFTQLLGNCFPLHPTVALLIGPLFRRFAQNERSLFAFLSSSEPYGLQEFLSNNHYDGEVLPTYTLSHLYDYLNAAHASRFYTADTGKKWTEIESAINQLDDPSEMTVRLIKTIGLLGIVGEPIPNLKASEQLLRYALDSTQASNTEFQDALSTLKNRSIVIYRRFNDNFSLWEGSDIDIEERLREAEKHVDTHVTLVTDLSNYMPTRPLVARKHLHETGTLRYFNVRYTDIDNFDSDISEPLDDADGLVLYTLPSNEHEVKLLTEKAQLLDSETYSRVLIAIPRSIGFLRDAVSQLSYLRWINENTPELEGDAVARRELSIRQVEAEREVSTRLVSIFVGVNQDACYWYYKGESLDIKSQRLRNECLSKICNEIYYKTPIIRNELINRRKISGAATTARRKLIRHMLENGDRKNLGIQGYPAEMSIYLSLLLDTGIHRYESNKWGFYPPKADDKNGLKHLWDAIEEFLEECEGGRKPIENLYERLMSLPYGLRKGPIPIFLCAAIIHYKTEIALYENGSFVADLSIPVFERLVKAPQQFELKRFRMAGIRVDVFKQLLQLLNQPTQIEDPDLLTVVAPLIRFIAQLPKYTLGTRTISENAQKLRSTVQNAREPDELLFKHLPEALGFSAFTAETADSDIVTDFFNTLQETLSELEQTYDTLLNSIEKMLRSAFNLKSTSEKLRAELFAKAEPMQELAVETNLKGFLMQLCSEGHDFRGWVEAIGTYLLRKPPASWLDTDIAQFEINLSGLARRFRHFEAISYEMFQHAESSGDEPIRVGITTLNNPEQERVITLQNNDKKQADEIEHEIEKLLDDHDAEGNTEFRLAVLARLSQKLMQKEEDSIDNNTDPKSE